MNSTVICCSVIILCLINFVQCDLNYRLPTAVWPSKYSLEITPHFEHEDVNKVETFDGNVQITLSTAEEYVSEIVLHSLFLEILPNITLNSVESSNEVYIISNRNYEEETHKNTFSLNKPLNPNASYLLNLRFHGRFSEYIGLYASHYSENNTMKTLAMTKLEPIHARRVFPCFDEPQFKANFVLTVNRPANFKPSISNTRIEKIEPLTERNLVRETFKETPKMPTYLLAFVVSEFAMIENSLKTINLYSAPELIGRGEYGLEIAEKGLNYFNELLDYDYFSVPNMEKLSLFAAPKHISTAMENWGLITFREETLLGTQLAHQWFGNLVTLEWFSYTWLNEGFAKYFGYMMTSQIEKEMDLDLKVVTDYLQEALRVDSMGLNAMTHTVNTPMEISVSFGPITYMKGASVIRMMVNLIGNDSFKEGLRLYIKQK